MLVGDTASSDLTTSPGAYDSTLGGSDDILVARFTALGAPVVAPSIATAVADATSTNQDVAVVVDPTVNDTDLNSDLIVEVDLTNPANGSVILNGDGTVTYTPDPGYTGTDTFGYWAIDTGATLAHYWGLAGDGLDAIGSADGSLTGTTTVVGDFGDALSFDEVNDTVTIPDFAYGSEFSLSFRFKIDDNSGSLFQYVYSHGDINATNSINVWFNEASHGTDPNVLRTVIRDGGDSLDNLALQIDISSLVGDGQWHTYTATADSSAGLAVYIDGTPIVSDGAHGTGAVNPAGSAYLAARQDLEPDRFFGGFLDTVQVYNRALSASEVVDLHAAVNVAAVSMTVDALAPQTYVVNSTGDSGDANTADGLCRTGGTNSQAADECTLRAAIEQANAHPGFDTIEFDIPTSELGYSASPLAYTIQPGSALAWITDPVSIDGSSQPGFAGTPIVELDGLSAGGNGLQLNAGSNGSTIRGLVINRFDTDGIYVLSTGVTIVGNYISTDVTGTADRGNDGDGIDVRSGNHIIGGTTAADRNLISGNNQFGISLDASTADNNVIRGNYIGVDVTGNAPLANADDGIRIQNAASNNTIVGTTAGAGNVISANGGNAFEIGDSGTSNNIIEGNYLGVGADGITPLGNGDPGIWIGAGASNNTIGGTTVGASNIIAHNSSQGVRIFSGTNNSVVGNRIYANSSLGLDLGPSGVTANDLGDGDAGANNLQNYPGLKSAYSLGGSTTILGTLNSAINTTYRIEFFSSPAGTEDPTGHGEGETYLGNATIITNVAGNATINSTLGVAVAAGDFVTATATDPGGSTSEFSLNVVAVDNILVVDTTSDLSNGDTSSIGALVGDKGFDGVISLREAITATNNTANGATPDEIHFNIPGGSHTIVVGAGGLPDITDAVIIDGTTEPDFTTTPIIELDGTSAGGGTDGLTFDPGSSGSAARGLVINRFDDGGVRVNTDSVTIAGNYIGTDVTGLVGLDNGHDGIVLANGTTGTTIGGTSPGAANTIAYNTGRGIRFATSAGADNTIVANSISNNGALGIDLDSDGVTFNDAGDGDAGSNDLLNFPEIASATDAAGTITVDFDLDVPGGDYRIEVFTNPSGADPSLYGEGQTYENATTITHTGSGIESFQITYSGATNDIVTLTATEESAGPAYGSTSEFSAAFTVTVDSVTTVNSTDDEDDAMPGDNQCDTGQLNSAGDPECTLRAAIEEANASAVVDTIHFDIPMTETGYAAAPLAFTISPTSALPNFTDALTIDGTTQPEFVAQARPVIELDGTSAGIEHGLDIDASSSTVRGLVINRWGNDGIHVSSGAVGTVIAANYFGTDVTGTVGGVYANAGNSIHLTGGASSSVIGGTDPSDRNILGASGSDNLIITGAGTDGNKVVGNYIGTDVSGMLALGGPSDAVDIQSDASATEILNNLISGSGEDGIDIDGAGGTIIQGNWIGVDATGINALGNSDGIEVKAPQRTPRLEARDPVKGTSSGATSAESTSTM